VVATGTHAALLDSDAGYRALVARDSDLDDADDDADEDAFAERAPR
jgi:hypothetical protein